jgi:N6-L-threonylcarbamoyladenine synthase
MLILGIETSCDETAASVVKDGREILSNVVASQVAVHRKFWGVVPEIASRQHLELINPVISEALSGAKIGFSDLDGIAVTYGPGLVGALLVGLATAKAIAYSNSLSFIGINHLEGHIYANYLGRSYPKTPFLGLIVSGGHSDLIYVKNPGSYRILGRTRDDAPGEAFDKVAKFLKLDYPGGPVIDKLAKTGNPKAISFPRASFKSKETLDFSFSGIKTAVVNYVNKIQDPGSKVRDIVTSFQEAVVDMLVKNTLKALELKRVKRLLLAGGVAANSRLRKKLKEETAARGVELYYPPKALCTDNAAMIASCGYYKIKKGIESDLALNAMANLSLGDKV